MPGRLERYGMTPRSDRRGRARIPSSLRRGHHRGTRQVSRQVILKRDCPDAWRACDGPCFASGSCSPAAAPARLAVDFGPGGDAAAPGVGADQLDDERPRRPVDAGKRDRPRAEPAPRRQRRRPEARGDPQHVELAAAEPGHGGSGGGVSGSQASAESRTGRPPSSRTDARSRSSPSGRSQVRPRARGGPCRRAGGPP